MKRLFFSLILCFFVFTAVGQERFDAVTTDGCTITYEVIDESTVKVYAFEQEHEGPVTIPSVVEGYTVIGIGYCAVQGGDFGVYSNYITSIFIPNTIEFIEPFAFQGGPWDYPEYNITQITFEENSNLTEIYDYAFAGCYYLTEITIPANVSYCGTFEGTAFQHVYFEEPSSLTEFPDYMFYAIPLQSIEIPEGVTSLGSNCFNDCYELTSVTLPSTLEYIGDVCFSLQSMNEMMPIAEIICNSIVPPALGNNIFGPWDGYEEWEYENIDPSAYVYNGVLKVPAQSLAAYQDAFGEYFPNIEPLADYVSNTNGLFNNNATWGEESNIDFEGKTIYIKKDHTITLNSELELDENTTLINDGLLIIEEGGELISSNSNNNLGIVEVETPVFSENSWHFIGAPFAGYALQSIVPRLDPSVCLFDYSNTNAWNNSWATINDNVSAGEGFFAYSWSNDKIIFTNYGDGMYSPNANSSYSSYNYNYSATPAYQINTGNVDVTKTLAGSSDAGHWMALANPYTFKLDVATFISDQGNAIQGGVSYRLNGETWQTVTEGVINVTEGFFVNFANGGSQTAHFKTTQRSTSSAKASIEREFVRLAMLEGEREIELLFAQNEDANEGYDIFDANKLFSPVEITEPYFVTNNIALVKEEVNTLPYYATMNVRSYENKEVKFKANYIPEGYSLSLIDGEETIDLNEGVEYATNVIAGENANRFKVLIKKSLSLGEAEELQVNIYNDNRNINIETLESDLQIEVYNALGQKVFATKDRNFMLNNVSAGAYLVKAFSKTASKTQKIVVK